MTKVEELKNSRNVSEIHGLCQPLRQFFVAAQLEKAEVSFQTNLLDISRSARFEAVSTKLARMLNNRKSNPKAIANPDAKGY